MACISPPELNGRDLLTHIDGEADEQVTAHLERCPHCREKARRLARLQGRLTAQLYRITCPSPEELGEYHLGMVTDDRAKAIAQHLSECPHCARESAQLKEFLADLAPALEPGRLERVRKIVRVLVARLVRGGGQIGPPRAPALAPIYAGVRGETKEPHTYQAEDIHVMVEIQDDAELPGRKMILGLVIGMEPGKVEAHLWRDDRFIAVFPVDELGNFVIPGLVPGSYELILSGTEVETHIQELDVETS